ncbi:NADH-dependent [FeFe] hydrogenase, group A6 [Haloplasma contractile]|uniref:NADH dehydrogenase I subunit G protein n=1 Tax=Haloplasma contractile SSD-17B TaxID=1033810 RepID=U2E878_9MOLU|nr:NADH-dependent [FeFe] hydrogenase, group A6 [Haloplasma contractile]ERJ11091.1 NADH dehydrogenase I subunit G protein [Haloplasma contractile SSD-17B]
MNKVNVKINGMSFDVPQDYTVLDACREASIDVPTLCFFKDMNETGACRMCVVEVEGARTLLASCVTPVRDGMNIKTSSKRVQNARKTNLELILANHNRECLLCDRNKSCELQDFADSMNVKDIAFKGDTREGRFVDATPSIVRDTSKCILCGRCISVCKKSAGMGILSFVERGFDTYVAPAFDFDMGEAGCIYCGQCINACPVSALKEKPEIDRVWDAINDEKKYVVFQTAPAVRAALGEEFGMEIGNRVTGKMVAALRRLGGNKVFDTNFAADLTIMEEANELLDRIKNGGTLPLITSCSPGWVRILENYYPEFIPNLSTCKSPHQMLGAVTKSYYAEKIGVNPKNMYVVSVMPCIAKKFEKDREEMEVNGIRDIDAVITTRELAKMIKEAGIDFNKLPNEEYDTALGIYSGAGVIFGATGGVMEAALRTAADVLEGKDLETFEYTGVRGVENIKEASLTLGGNEYNIAVVHGGNAAKQLLEMVKNGEKNYHFIEIMGCTGGCVNGGGQPHVHSKIKNSGIDVRTLRAKALYEEDQLCTVRKSHQNKAIQELYRDFLGEPNSHKSHELLHTHYVKREIYPNKK